MILASDLDGVLAKNILNKADFRPFRLHQYYAKCVPGPCWRPYLDVIITGRRIHYKKVTVDWLRENNVEYKTLVMFPNKVRKNNRSLAKFKAEKINEMGISVLERGEVVKENELLHLFRLYFGRFILTYYILILGIITLREV